MDFSYNKVAETFDNILDAALHHRKQVLLGLIGVVVLALSIVGYCYYNRSQQAAAHKDFIVALRYYDAPVTGSKTVMTSEVVEFATDADKWKNVEEIFKKGYQKHRRTGLGSMFHAYQANALARLGDIDQAIDTLQATIKEITSKEIKDFYILNLALLQLDAKEEVIREAGFEKLVQLAQDDQSNANESALYYLGAYYWDKKDYAQVKNYWQQLMVKYGLKDAKQQSGFAEIVRAKLKLISPEW